MTLSAGSQLGPYEILAPLGAGGMGEVYRARDPRLGREVAIKVLPASLSQDADRLRRFEQEARAAGVLNHPNVTAVYDIGEKDGSPYVVQELLEGETLRGVLAVGRLPAGRAVEYALQIASGLAAAHEKGIVHRDLKPENIFVTADDRVKILDFGLVKLIRPEPSPGSETSAPTETTPTEPGTVMGTVGYMSPEQVRGKSADARSDIFSFGAILYEMLSGRRAFQRDSSIETMSAILKEEPPEEGLDAAGVTPATRRVVQRCLEKNPAARFQSARDLGFALAEADSSASVMAPRERRNAARYAIAAAAGLALVAAVLAVRAGVTRGRSDRAPSPGAIRSVAVLPLDNFSRDPEQEYFADGMTEALITDLAQIRSLRVISRTSVMGYRSAKKPLPQIGKELDVDAVVEGSIQKSGDRVRITAQLVKASNDQHIWAKSYERDLKDVLGLQSEVARAVAAEIRAAVTPEEKSRLAEAPPVDPEAYELYLKGRYSLGKQTESSIRKAIDYFNAAITKDPGFSKPYSGLSDSYSSLRSVYAPPRDVMPAAKAAALKAVELDPASAEAHLSLAQVHFFWDFDWSAAEREFKRALELNPNLADAHDVYATYLAAMRRHPEAIAEIRRARDLDPLSLVIMADATWVYYLARQYDNAVEEGRRAVELDPSFWFTQAMLGLAYEKAGRYDEAIATLQQARKLNDSPTILEMLGGAYAAAGRRDEARRIVEELTTRSQRGYVCAYEVATVFAGLGDRDRAIEWLRRSETERADCAPWMFADSKLDPLHDDPRYRELVSRLGFPGAQGMR